jgi:hypothetical protein
LKAFKSFTRGEISELTRLVHDTREIAIDRLKSEADQLGAEDVVGVKTYIAEIGHGLVEFMAIGTAVKKTAGVSVATSALPVQAVVPDKDTWIDGDFGFQLDRIAQSSSPVRSRRGVAFVNRLGHLRHLATQDVGEPGSERTQKAHRIDAVPDDEFPGRILLQSHTNRFRSRKVR